MIQFDVGPKSHSWDISNSKMFLAPEKAETNEHPEYRLPLIKLPNFLRDYYYNSPLSTHPCIPFPGPTSEVDGLCRSTYEVVVLMSGPCVADYRVAATNQERAAQRPAPSWHAVGLHPPFVIATPDS